MQKYPYRVRKEVIKAQKRKKRQNNQVALFPVLTNETFDAQRLNLHVDEQATVGLNQGGGEGHVGLGLGQSHHSGHYTVDETVDKNTWSTHYGQQ